MTEPHNIGFDEHGVVRIFDFGLAREVDSQGQLRHDTGAAGTPRYMSPEIAKNESYNFSTDVYSFSILFWEILTLTTPFKTIKSLSKFNEKVVRGKLRPSLNAVSAPDLKALLQQGWHQDPTHRPDFVTVCRILREHLTPSHTKGSRSFVGKLWASCSQETLGRRLGEVTKRSSRQSCRQ